MKSILDELYDSYVCPALQAKAQQKIDKNHKLLQIWILAGVADGYAIAWL